MDLLVASSVLVAFPFLTTIVKIWLISSPSGLTFDRVASHVPSNRRGESTSGSADADLTDDLGFLVVEADVEVVCRGRAGCLVGWADCLAGWAGAGVAVFRGALTAALSSAPAIPPIMSEACAELRFGASVIRARKTAYRIMHFIISFLQNRLRGLRGQPGASGLPAFGCSRAWHWHWRWEQVEQLFARQAHC